MTAQNTGNVFDYKYDKKSEKYDLIEAPYIMTTLTLNYNIPNYILDGIFEVTRDNSNKLKLEEKVMQFIRLQVS